MIILPIDLLKYLSDLPLSRYPSSEAASAEGGTGEGKKYKKKGRKMSLSENDIITKNPKIAQRLFEERMLVITAKDSMLHRFNEVGTFIWSIIDKPLSIQEICTSLEEHFMGFEIKKSSQEILDFIQALEKKGLVTIQQK